MPSKPQKNKCRHCQQCNEVLENERSPRKATVKKKTTKDIKKEKLDKTEYNVIIKNFLEEGCTNGNIIPTSMSIPNKNISENNITNKKITSKKSKGVSKSKVTAKEETLKQKLKSCPKSPKKKCTEKTPKATYRTKNNISLDLINEVARQQLLKQAYIKQDIVYPYPVASIKIEEVTKQPKKATPKPKNNKKIAKKSAPKVNVVKKNQNKENVPKTKPELTTETLPKKKGRPRITKNSNKTSAVDTLTDSAHVIEANLLNQLPDLNPDTYFLTQLPNLLPSRTSSTTSEVDTFSWAKEISSSSASLVTVPPNDIITIDGKLPVVYLDSIENVFHKMSFGDSVSLCNDANETDNESVYIKSHSLRSSLNLSTSTLKSSTSSSNSYTTRYDVDIGNSKNDLQTKLQKDLFDFQSEPMENILNKATKQLLVILKTEAIIMEDCCSVRALINNTKEDHVSRVDAIVESVGILPAESTAIAEMEDLVDSHIPLSNILELLEPESPIDDKNCNGNSPYHHSPIRMENQEQDHSKEDNSINKETIQTVLLPFVTTENNIAEPSVSRYNEQDKGDDDCLSLYAESMSLESTCLDTTTITKKFTINNESSKNYTPLQETKKITFTQPLFKHLQPEKTQLISKPDQSQNIKIICRNYNAPSINAKNRVIVTEPIFNENDLNMYGQMNNETDNLKHTPPNEVAFPYKSVLLMNSFCFRNLTTYCRFGSSCKFKHTFPTDVEISMKLEQLTNELFNSEYLKLRRHDKPMYMYLKCFVDNCLYRGMPRLLFQMAIDTQNLNHDNIVWKTTILENILVSLKEDDIDMCKDLLMFSFENDYLLCDLFMQVISNSQNLSQFQSVLGILATFFMDIKRIVHVDVALKVLDRASILPHNEELLLSILKIVYNTDSSILSNQLMVFLRNAVSELNSELLNEFMKLHGGLTDKVTMKLSSGVELTGVDNSRNKSANLNNWRNMPVSSEMLLNKARFCSNNFRHNNHNMNGPPTQMDMNFKTARNPFNKWKAVPNRRFMLPHQQNNKPQRQNPYELLIDRRF